jgi:ketosteroid isomerase-like protein
MLVRYKLRLLLGLLFLSTACQQAAPPDTHDADVKAIKDLEAAWVQGFNSKDIDKAMAFYASDASLLIPNAPIMNGTDAIKAGIKPILDDPNFKLDFSGTRVDVAKSGELGYSQGPYSMTTTDPATKKPSVDKGKYLTIFKKQPDGSWKAVEDTFMTDLPVQTPPKR